MKIFKISFPKSVFFVIADNREEAIELLFENHPYFKYQKDCMFTSYPQEVKKGVIGSAHLSEGYHAALV